MTKAFRLFRFAGLPASILMVTAIAYAASDVDNATVTQVRVDNNTPNAGIVTISPAPASGKPACATFGNGEHFVVDLGTNAGRETLKLATAAFLAGKKVRLVGTGACTTHTNKENLQSLYMKN